MIPADIRYIGYRSIEMGEEYCAHLLEFAFVLWERNTVAPTVEHRVNFFNSSSSEMAYILGDVVVNDQTFVDESLIYDVELEEERCAGLRGHHSSNGVNTVLRVCSNDVGLDKEGTYEVGFLTRSLGKSQDKLPETVWIRVPGDVIQARNYDIRGGQTLSKIAVTGTFSTPTRESPLGLLFLTDSYRSPTQTGAAAPGTEAFAILRRGVEDPPERTEDVLEFPVLSNLRGPGCNWTVVPDSCPVLGAEGRLSVPTSLVHTESTIFNLPPRKLQTGRCPERNVPEVTFSPTLPPEGTE